VPAAELATALMGDSIATNMFMLGYAWQKGWVPLERASIERAIELNGVAVAFNLQSFVWGRRAAVDMERVRRVAMPADVLVSSTCGLRRAGGRAQYLTGYQVPPMRGGIEPLWKVKKRAEKQPTAAKLLRFAKLLPTKTVEVARLYTDGAFGKIEAMFEGDYKLVFTLPRRCWRSLIHATSDRRK
jgi:indolepyruvate ferredoxin oxidoreductase